MRESHKNRGAFDTPIAVLRYNIAGISFLATAGGFNRLSDSRSHKIQICEYEKAEVAESVDARDLKSLGC